jgi:hypothetical protein
MKRFIYLTLLFTATLQLKAQQMNIETAEGTTSVDYATYETVRLTFANGKMQLMNDDTVVKTFDIKKISRIYFYSTNDIKTATTEPWANYSPLTQELQVSATPGTRIDIYHLNGAVAYTDIQTIATSAIKLAHLPAGTYVLSAGNQTYKFVKP